MACHDVGEVPKRLRRVALGSDVDVNSAPAGGVALRARLAQPAAKLLQEFNVAVAEDRGDHLALFAVRTLDADVPLEFPLAARAVPGAPGVVAVAVGGVLVSAGSEELGGELGGRLAGDAVHLDLDADCLALEVLDLLFGLVRHCCILRFPGLSAPFW